MERERLNHLMQDPSRVAKEDLAGLAELTGRYPWFSAAHLLLAVGEHATGDVLYDERARTAAAHLPMRSVLFDLVHPVPASTPLPEASPYAGWATAPVVEAMAPVTALPMVEPPAPLPPPVMPVVEAPIPVVDTPVIALPIAPSGPVSEVPVEPWPIPTAVPEAIAPPPPVPVVPAAAPVQAAAVSDEMQEADPLDALIRQAAFAGTYELLLDHEIGNAPPSAEAAPEPEAPAEQPLAKADVPPPTPVAAPRPRSAGKLRFTDWLEQAGPSEAAPVAASSPAHSDWIRSTGPAIASPIAARPEPAPPAPTEVPATKPKGGMSVLDAASLIDSFIRQEHPEPPKRTEFFNPQTAAKRSLEEHVELVTETLARIYEQQGNTAKAMAAYRKLAERHPERKDHFLGLAKALEGKGKA